MSVDSVINMVSSPLILLKCLQINYLRARKPATVGLINVFHMLFTDEAMYSYNYSGVCNRGSKRKAMQHYSIFMGCMLGLFNIA